MTNLLRWAVVAIATLHGLIHLLGAAERFGWTDDPTLERSDALGVLWLAAAIALFAAALLAALGAPTWWWILAVAAAVTSQVAILTSWDISGSGTLVNLLILYVALYSFMLRGPPSFRAQWKRRASEALATVDPDPGPVTEADLAALPGPLAAYVRRSGAVGRPRPTSLQVRFSGRIRSAPHAAWMPFRARQVSTLGPNPQRLFLMDATRSGLPVTVLHVYCDVRATMRAKVMSMITVVDASGPEMDLGETVTVFNDLVVLAPGAIPDAPVTWTDLGERRVRGVFTNGDQTVSAVLTFDETDDLVDFVSEDRSRVSPDGKSFVRQPWSTPLRAYRQADGRRVLSSGAARWRTPDGWFTYIELEVEEVLGSPTLTVDAPSTHPSPPRRG
ncbi:DUF6544 family protein [Aeromicrobium flavum]|nr:DUF6544 family protein [Aeromicrobium flavum]